MNTEKTKREKDAEVDRNSEDSFPASDPVSPFVPAVPVEDEKTDPDDTSSVDPKYGSDT